jgi:hypothetical protein
MLIPSSRRRHLKESIDVSNYRIEVVLTFFIWAFALQTKMMSHTKYRAEFKKLNRLIFPLHL